MKHDMDNSRAITLAGAVTLTLTIVIRATTAEAQKPPLLPPPEAVQALMDCAPWWPDYVPNPTIPPPTDLRAHLELDLRRVRLAWQDNAENETCYGVLKTFPPGASPVGGPDPMLMIVALANATQATDVSFFPAPGRYCYQVYAGNAAGRSALSNPACVEAPDELAPVPTLSPIPSLLPSSPTAGVVSGAAGAPATGIPEVDAVIRAVLAQDRDALVAMARYTEVECIGAPVGGGAPPLCSSVGAPEGSIIGTLPVSISETEYMPQDMVPHFFQERLSRSGFTFYGVLRPERLPSAAYLRPVAEYAVVCQARVTRGLDLAFHLLEGAIVAVQGFGTGALDLPAPDDPAWLVPPQP